MNIFEFSAEQRSRRGPEFGRSRAVEIARTAQHRRPTRIVPRVVQVALAHVKVAAAIRRNIRHTQVRRGLASRLNYIIFLFYCYRFFFSFHNVSFFYLKRIGYFLMTNKTCLQSKAKNINNDLIYILCIMCCNK